MEFTQLNENGRYTSGSKKHSESFTEVLRDANSIVTNNDGLKAQEVEDKLVALEANLKTTRDKSLDDLVVTHNTVAYDANGKAIGNMSAVMGVANFKFNQAVAQGASVDMAYQAIYKSKIYWRGADDKNHSVMIESVCETLEKSMNAVSTIVVR